MSAPVLSAAVTAANDLTARWCAAQDSREFVLSGAGLWPLLSLLSEAADGPARTELSAATGRPASAGRDDALDLLQALSGDADPRPRSVCGCAAICRCARSGSPRYHRE